MTRPASKVAERGRFYWDNPVKHDRPLITNCSVPGLACAAGLKPSSATEERDLDMLLANIALADQEGRPLSYSRHKEHNYQRITFGRVLSAVEIVKRAELATEWRQLPGRRGWQSTLTATPSLTEIFNKHGQDPVYGLGEPIILRSRKDGSLLPLPAMRDRVRQVEAINEMLSTARLDLSMTGALLLRNNLWRFERLEYDSFGRRPFLIKQVVRLDRMTARRVFTSNLTKHGRLYCPAQNIPANARLQATMSGEQVVELDFRSMHVALAYHLCGAHLVDDPYEGISGFTRNQAKLALLTTFNATSVPAAIASLTDARRGKPVVTSQRDALRLIEALQARHAPIAGMLCSDAGMTLMNCDSRIMLGAVDRLITAGIQCIPYHDSILVPAQHEGAAHEALNFGWSAQNVSITLCHIDKKSPKAPQHGYEDLVSAAGLDHPGPCPFWSSEGWWASVLDDALFDVVEWVSASGELEV
jgi:hypothetical protein